MLFAELPLAVPQRSTWVFGATKYENTSRMAVQNGIWHVDGPASGGGARVRAAHESIMVSRVPRRGPTRPADAQSASELAPLIVENTAL